MLCLGKKIRRYISRICRLICDDEDLRRPCHGIDADIAVHRFFRKSDIDISRSYDLIGFFDTFRSIGECRNGLGAAHLVYGVHSSFFCRNKGVRADRSVRSRRSHHDDFIYARDPGRNHIHQNRGWIDRFSAWNINAHPVNRSHFLSEHGSVRFTVKPTILLLFFVVASDIFKGFSDHLDKRSLCLTVGILDLLIRHPYCVLCEVCMIKPARIGKERLISVFLYVF